MNIFIELSSFFFLLIYYYYLFARAGRACENAAQTRTVAVLAKNACVMEFADCRASNQVRITLVNYSRHLNDSR